MATKFTFRQHTLHRFLLVVLVGWAAGIGGKAYGQAPTISSFSPASGSIGTLISVTGTNLSNVTSCSLGGTSGIVVSKAATKVVLMVMPGTSSGTVSVTNPSGSATSSTSFTVTAVRVPRNQEGSKLVGTGAVGSAQQGYSTAISADGNTVIVGGAYDKSGQGAVWVFTRSGTTWSQQGIKFSGTDSVADPNAGWSVDLSADGNTAIVGGPGDVYGVGSAWVFTRSGSTWSQQGSKLVGSGSTGGTGGLVYQGSSVSLSADGNTALIGGFYDNNLKGAIWIFKRSGSTWTQQGSKLVPSDNTGYAGFGSSAALSADGNTAVIGGYYDNNSVGATWVFTYNGSAWSQQGSKLVGTGSVGAALQGYSVAISADGNTIISGGPYDNSSVGAAWVFTRSGSTWSQQGAKIIGTGYTGGSPSQGNSVAISADGNVALLGGNADASNLGATWVFKRSGTTWSQNGNKLVGTGNTGAAQQGYFVALSANGENAVVGGYGDNSFVGASWIFTPASSNADLSNLTISSGTLTPAFSASTLTYTVSVSNATSSVTVTPTAQDANATIQVRVNAGSYQTVTSGSASTALALNVGSNSIEVLVTAPDGTTTSTYTITVTRACPNFTASLSGSASICAGSSTNLIVTVSGGTSPYTVVYSGGTVNNYTSGANIPVSPSSNTTYTLTSVTDVNGCTSTVSGSASITLKANVAITSVTAAANPICPGTTTTLTANGVTGSNAIVNFWTGSNGTGTNLGTGTTLTGAGAGTYYSRVTGDCGTPAQAVVNVTNFSVASVSNQTASSCTGLPFTVNPSGVPGGTTYTWGVPTYSGSISGGTAGNNQSSITQTLTNSGAADGTATYTVTPTTGSCNGAAFTITATVHPGTSPTFSSSAGASTCAGTNITYTTQSGMSNYNWTITGTSGTDYTITGGGTGSTSNTVTIKWLTAGSKTVTANYTSATGCASATSASSTTNVTAALTPSVTITITSGTNPTCANGSITFAAAPVNGGASPTYQWYKNNVAVTGATGASYTVSGITSGSNPTVYVIMTATAGGCLTSSTATSPTTTITVVGSSWTGSFNNQFADGRNWCDGTVPTATSDVLIPVTPRDPIITGIQAVRNIEIQTGAKVTINNTTLTVNGTVTGNGEFGGVAASALVLTANANIGTLYFGSTGIGSLRLTGTGASVTLGNATAISKELNVANATLNTGGNLVLKSDINGTAWVAPISTGNINGQVTVERYIPQNAFRAWRLLSVPVKGTLTFHQAWQENQPPMADGKPGYGTLLTSSTAGNGFDTQTSGNSLLAYNSVNQSFDGVSNTNNGMQTTSGYFVYIRGHRGTGISGSVFYPTATTLRTTGTLYQGTQPVITLPAGKNVLVGNIFASPIDFSNVTRTGVNSFKVWDPKLAGAYNLGAYQTFSAINGYDPIPGGGSYGSTANSRIESGQAFFVTSSTGGTIQLTEAAKTSGSQNVFRTTGKVAQLKTNLYVVTADGPLLADGNAVVYGDDLSSGSDNEEVVKLKNIGENLAIDISGEDYTIDTKNRISANDVIQFSVSNLKQGDYKLEFIPKGLDGDIKIAYLADKFLGTSTSIPLDKATTVDFKVTADLRSFARDRFRIVFRKDRVELHQGYVINPNPVTDQTVHIQFNNQPQGKYMLRLLNETGQVVQAQTVNHEGGYANTMMNLNAVVASGLYRIEILQPDKQRSIQNLVIANGK